MQQGFEVLWQGQQLFQKVLGKHAEAALSTPQHFGSMASKVQHGRPQDASASTRPSVRSNGVIHLFLLQSPVH